MILEKIRDVIRFKSDSKDYSLLLEQIYVFLSSNDYSLKEVEECIAIDENDILPFDLKKSLYEILIKRNCASKYIKEYAYWLQLNGGPDWDDYSNELLKSIH